MDYEALYRLQDRVLEAVFGVETQFYLTGGTCLHRFHANKRYSDDLDLFTSDNTLYRDDVRRALDSIARAGLQTETSVDSRDFVRVFVDKRLKVDFVNDRVYRHGMPVVSPEGYRLDNLVNIFANKLCALIGRDEPKDVFDICLLSQLDEAPSIGLLAIARRKCVIDLEELEYRLESFPPELLESLAVADDDYRAYIRKNFPTIVRCLLDSLLATGDNSREPKMR
jgi:predicted nucleotidyltransferase component of viral defense system